MIQNFSEISDFNSNPLFKCALKSVGIIKVEDLKLKSISISDGFKNNIGLWLLDLYYNKDNICGGIFKIPEPQFEINKRFYDINKKTIDTIIRWIPNDDSNKRILFSSYFSSQDEFEKWRNDIELLEGEKEDKVYILKSRYAQKILFKKLQNEVSKRIMYMCDFREGKITLKPQWKKVFTNAPLTLIPFIDDNIRQILVDNNFYYMNNIKREIIKDENYDLILNEIQLRVS